MTRMIRLREAFLLAAGAAGGVALVLSCGNGPTSVQAQSSSGGSGATGAGGACTACPSHVVTADTDMNQLESGTASCASGAEVNLVSGPFVLTDADHENGSVTGSSLSICGSRFVGMIGAPHGNFNSAVSEFQTIGNRPSLHGARVFIGAGESLCVTCEGSSAVSWSGFRPYSP